FANRIVDITPVNDAPVAAASSKTVAEDTVLTGTVPASDVDNASLSYSVVTPPANGTLTAFDTATGAYSYTPAANYNGPDSFTFKANDGLADSNVATVTITVTPVNDAPVAVGTSLTVAEDSTATAGTVTATDIDGPPAATFAIGTPPTNGTALLNPATGTFTYQPNPNYNGPDSFTFKANDGSLDSTPATVTITVTAVNDAPVAAADLVSTGIDTPITFDVRGNDSDVDDARAALTVTLTSSASAGGISCDAAGSCTYTPAHGFSGIDTFTYQVTDPHGLSSQATVTITVGLSLS
ncbi:MAG: large repetitive protein, partial [Actinomycetota bacterium]|nr:large repetitive protein [Actinomycetota bacterium]